MLLLFIDMHSAEASDRSSGEAEDGEIPENHLTLI